VGEAYGAGGARWQPFVWRGRTGVRGVMLGVLARAMQTCDSAWACALQFPKRRKRHLGGTLRIFVKGVRRRSSAISRALTRARAREPPALARRSHSLRYPARNFLGAPTGKNRRRSTLVGGGGSTLPSGFADSVLDSLDEVRTSTLRTHRAGCILAGAVLTLSSLDEVPRAGAAVCLRRPIVA
jgi:hypothetical protein